jgi:hypothetical protein
MVKFQSLLKLDLTLQRNLFNFFFLLREAITFGLSFLNFFWYHPTNFCLVRCEATLTEANLKHVLLPKKRRISLTENNFNS